MQRAYRRMSNIAGLFEKRAQDLDYNMSILGSATCGYTNEALDFDSLGASAKGMSLDLTNSQSFAVINDLEQSNRQLLLAGCPLIY